jgi:N-acetylglutamate synthase-like GNAT family acetyltransferase
MACLRDDEIVAPPGMAPWLTLVFVHPFYRGQGIVRQLVIAIESYARKLDVKSLYLSSVYGEGLYKKLGWLSIDKLSNDN